MDTFIAYYRVSTQRQGTSGLGLEAQRVSVAQHVKSRRGNIALEFTEIETGTGANALKKRPELRQALEACKRLRAILIIAKLDRLARNVHFVSGLMESGVRFIACDLPEANELTLHLMAAFAEHEARRISERTREALARVKAKGKKLGRAGWSNLLPHLNQRTKASKHFADSLEGQIRGYRLRGLSQREMVNDLNIIGITAPRGGRWSLLQLQRVLSRLDQK